MTPKHNIYPEGRQERCVNGENITKQVQAWQQQQGVVWPWDDLTQAQFALTFL